MEKELLGPRERVKLLSGRRDSLIPLLPKDWKVRTIQIAPEYNTKKGNDLMSNVRWGKSNDEKLMTIWEQILTDINTQNTNSIRAMKKSKIVIP